MFNIYSNYTPDVTLVYTGCTDDLMCVNDRDRLLQEFLKECEDLDDSYYCEKKLEPEKVIFNYPATIVFWNDGTKTVVKCDIPTLKRPINWKEQGFLNAYVKKCDPKYVEMLCKWVDGYK